MYPLQIITVREDVYKRQVLDVSVPVEMLPKDLREAFFNGDATMMIALFDNKMCIRDRALFFQNSIDLYLTYAFLHYTFDNMEQSD